MSTENLPTSSDRLNFAKSAPEAFRSILALDASWRPHLDSTLVELLQIRVSQINGCAYCLHLHTSDAIDAGEDPARLAVVGVWREARHLFTDHELLALELAEQLTTLDENGVTKDVYERVAHLFGEKTTAHLIAQIMTINTWNRIARVTAKVAGTDERRQ